MGKNTLSTTDANLKIAEADGWTQQLNGLWTWCDNDPDFPGIMINQPPPSYTGPSGDPIRSAIARMPDGEQIEVARTISDLVGSIPVREAKCGLYIGGILTGLIISPLTLCTAFLRVKLNDPQLVIDQP